MYPETDDPFAVNMAGVRDISDIHLVNNFGSKDEYEDFLVKNFKLPELRRK